VHETDCRAVPEGSGACAELPATPLRARWVGCRTPCDPAAKTSACANGWALTCATDDAGTFVVRAPCDAGAAAAER
jgi:hypothetical protein